MAEYEISDIINIRCDPSQTCTWLLKQANELYNEQSLSTTTQVVDRLYNATRQSPIDLHRRIGTCISPQDRIEGSFRSSEIQLPSVEQAIDYPNGLFFQQLHAFHHIGTSLGPQTSGQKQKLQQQQRLLDLMKIYISGCSDPPVLPENSYGPEETENVNSLSHSEDDVNDSDLNYMSPTAALHPHHLLRMSRSSFTDSESDHGHERAVVDSDGHPTPSSSPQLFRQDTVDDMFDLVFREQAIGLKLGTDEKKMYAIVKECLPNTEAAAYPEIEPGVVILAVNQKNVHGIGLSKTLACLRETKRPVVVRFGKRDRSMAFR